MTGSRALAEHILDLLGPRPDVDLVPFFGGWSLRHEGKQIGIVMDTAYAKVDSAHRDNWHDNGSVPFRYTARGRTITVEAYWSVPADALEDSNLLRDLLFGTGGDAGRPAGSCRRVMPLSRP
ncbi:TfoX/Sxy family protein [Actinoplanes sp. NPDC023801]|uniref:TfoX/Sxy family protein n=1 Tax=Actinoplanes sp. NPDC023801 TaxID=3154595 RepID=UPI0033CA9FD0